MRAGHTQQQKSQHADQLARLGEYDDQSLDLNNTVVDRKIEDRKYLERDLLW